MEIVLDKLNENYVNYINQASKGMSSYIVEIPNTKGVSSQLLATLNSNVSLRIAGGYDVDRIKRNPTDKRLLNACVYSKNETIHLLCEIERIESGISSNWSDIQKIIYLYDKLKTYIKYDPKFESKPSKETRSLRGLITRQSVCAGFAQIYKELLDRQGIENEYVVGGVEKGKPHTHAWNLIKIGNDIFPIDLTWDAVSYRRGIFSKNENFANADEFRKYHIPDHGEKTIDYSVLKSIDQDFVDRIREKNNNAREHWISYYKSTGTRLFVAQVGDTKIGDTRYYRYVFADTRQDASGNIICMSPYVLYAGNNLNNVRHSLDFANEKIEFRQKKSSLSAEMKEEVEKLIKERESLTKMNQSIRDVLFSDVNIRSALNKGKRYLGGIKLLSDGTPSEKIEQDDNIDSLFNQQFRVVKRSNGTTIFVEKVLGSAFVDGVEAYHYHCFEILNVNGSNIVKENRIYSEMDLIKDQRQLIADSFLSRERLDRKAKQSGGYVGYYDEKNTQRYNPNFWNYFQNNDRIELKDNDILEKTRNTGISQKKSAMTQSISFEQLQDYTRKYEVRDENGKIVVYDKNTGRIVTDPVSSTIARFSDMWLYSAGVYYSPTDDNIKQQYAFNDGAKETYKLIESVAKKGLCEKGNVDSEELFDLSLYSQYKHANKIVTNLFRTPNQSQVVNDFFRLQTPNALAQTTNTKTSYEILNDRISGRNSKVV